MSRAQIDAVVAPTMGFSGLTQVIVRDAEGRVVLDRVASGRQRRFDAPATGAPIRSGETRHERRSGDRDGAGTDVRLDLPLGARAGVVVGLAIDRDFPELAPLRGLSLLYLVATALALVVFGYGALTRLIVRPVESLTLASERLAAGKTDVSVPVGGAAEVARLAVAFNEMAAQLRNDRALLVSRLAQLEARTRELREAQDGLVRSEKLASVGKLAAGVAHEVGNPLSAILGFTELLLADDEMPQDERHEYLRRVRSETERIHRIIGDLLEYSRRGPAEQGEAVEGDVEDALDAAVGLVAPQKTFRSIDVVRTLPGDLPKVRVSTDRLTQVLLNLLLNAADAIADRSSSRESTIRVDVDVLDGWRPSGASSIPPGRAVRVSVTDTGPGIPEDVLPRIFDPFFTTKQTGKGTGLGLAVVQGIVEGAGGTLSASNARGPDGPIGASFVLVLPAIPVRGREEDDRGDDL